MLVAGLMALSAGCVVHGSGGVVYSEASDAVRALVEASGIPVSIGSVRVAPGDLVRGDADGVVVLPSAHEDAILNAAEAIARAEDAIRALARDGTRLDDARRQHGYHRLQSRKEPA